MSPSTWPGLRLSAIQGTLAVALLVERARSVFDVSVGLGGYGLALAALGLWLAWPSRAQRRSRRAWLDAGLQALALALLSCTWRAGFEGLAPSLSPTWLADWAPWLLLASVLLLDRQAVMRVSRLTRIEAQKLVRARIARYGVGASVGLALLSGLTHEAQGAETRWTVLVTVLGPGFAAAQVFLLVLGAISIAGEASQGTLKMILPHAYRRSDWVWAKALALVLATLAFSLAIGATAWLVAAAGGPLGDVTQTTSDFGGDPLVTVHSGAAVMRGHVLATVGADMGALLATGALGLLISCWIPSVVGALCTAFLAFAALKLGDLFLALDRETLQRLFTWPPPRMREVTASLSKALSSEYWDARLPAVSLLLSAASAGLFLLLSTRLFAHKDLHV